LKSDKSGDGAGVKNMLDNMLKDSLNGITACKNRLQQLNNEIKHKDRDKKAAKEEHTRLQNEAADVAGEKKKLEKEKE